MQVDGDGKTWTVMPPSYRYDINIEADLIEEIGRLIGYDNIPGSREASHIRMDSFSETRVGLTRDSGYSRRAGLFRSHYLFLRCA